MAAPPSAPLSAPCAVLSHIGPAPIGSVETSGVWTGWPNTPLVCDSSALGLPTNGCGPGDEWRRREDDRWRDERRCLRGLPLLGLRLLLRRRLGLLRRLDALLPGLDRCDLGVAAAGGIGNGYPGYAGLFGLAAECQRPLRVPCCGVCSVERHAKLPDILLLGP